MYRYVLCIVVVCAAAGCRPSRVPAAVPVAVVDLVREFDRAEKAPAAGFTVASHLAAGTARPSIVMPVPARVIWTFPLPRHGMFRAAVAIDAAGNPAAAVRFRFGVSDHRIYERLEEITIAGDRTGWTDLRADLSAYAGFKWSLFYRPDAVAWRVVLATDVVGDVPAGAVWGSPEIVTDTSSAREYVTRRQQLR